MSELEAFKGVRDNIICYEPIERLSPAGRDIVYIALIELSRLGREAAPQLCAELGKELCEILDKNYKNRLTIRPERNQKGSYIQLTFRLTGQSRDTLEALGIPVC